MHSRGRPVSNLARKEPLIGSQRGSRTSETPRVPLLEIRNLKIDFTGGGVPIRAVDDVSLSIDPGEPSAWWARAAAAKASPPFPSPVLCLRLPARYAGGEIRVAGPGRSENVKTRIARRPGRRRELCFPGPGASLNSGPARGQPDQGNAPAAPPYLGDR